MEIISVIADIASIVFFMRRDNINYKGVVKMSVGENIRQLRQKKDISLGELSEAVHVTKSMICQIERGTRIPTIILAYDISKVLGCKLEDLLI